MDATKHVLAVVFDFDDTLTDDSTTALLEKHGIATTPFWERDVKKLVIEEGWDSTLAWLHLFMKLIEQGTLPKFTSGDLNEFGRALKPYPGLVSLFRDVRKIAAGESTDKDLFEVEFYIISGGIQDIIEGFKLRHEFKAIWGCQLATTDGVIRYVKRAITFTEKTRYLFEINKGISYEESVNNPLLVNKSVLESKRRVPFDNMIYVGDGLTDIPCFSLVRKQSNDKGKAFGVFKPGIDKSARRALLELLNPGRVVSAHAPKYGHRDELGSLLRTAIQARCLDIKLGKVAG